MQKNCIKLAQTSHFLFFCSTYLYGNIIIICKLSHYFVFVLCKFSYFCPTFVIVLSLHDKVFYFDLKTVSKWYFLRVCNMHSYRYMRKRFFNIGSELHGFFSGSFVYVFSISSHPAAPRKKRIKKNIEVKKLIMNNKLRASLTCIINFCLQKFYAMFTRCN